MVEKIKQRLKVIEEKYDKYAGNGVSFNNGYNKAVMEEKEFLNGLLKLVENPIDEAIAMLKEDCLAAKENFL